MTNCSELMTRDPQMCNRDTRCTAVARMMRDGNFGSMPVVSNDREKKLVGVVTDRDLCIRLIAEGRDPDTVRVADVMTTQPLQYCRPNDDVQVAMDLMEKHQVRRIPVCDDAMHVIGIIAQADLARHGATVDQMPEVMQQISKPTGSRTGTKPHQANGR